VVQLFALKLLTAALKWSLRVGAKLRPRTWVALAVLNASIRRCGILGVSSEVSTSLGYPAD